VVERDVVDAPPHARDPDLGQPLGDFPGTQLRAVADAR
jgi:hypothetical protein